MSDPEKTPQQVPPASVEAAVPYLALTPYQRTVDGLDLCIRPMNADDVAAMLDFGRALSDQEILVLRLNLRRRRSIEEWVAAIEQGHRITLVAEREGSLLAYASLSLRGLRWYRHLGDVRLVVLPELRSRGLGSTLVYELVDIARRIGLRRLIAQIPRSQKAASRFFRRFDFHQQVLLPDWVIDGEGNTQDLLLLTRDL